MSFAPSPLADLYILIPTFDRYLDLARITARRIDELWPEHPPIFFCGLTGRDERNLSLRSPPDNWIAVLADACHDLRGKGARLVYLILDDHPAMGPCHAKHLNQTMPKLMEASGAVCLSLQGWDHPRRVGGSIKRCLGFSLMRLNREFTSKFALHPALWKLEVLEAMCTRFLTMSPPGRTPWDFERLSGDPQADFSDEWKESSFRICGSEMEIHRKLWPVRILRRSRMKVLRGLHSLVRWLTGTDIQDRLTHRGFDWDKFEGKRMEFRIWLKRKHQVNWPWITRTSRKKLRRILEGRMRINDVWYHGPYPMVFTGVLRRGEFNGFLRTELQASGQTEFLTELESVVPPTSEASKELPTAEDGIQGFPLTFILLLSHYLLRSLWEKRKG